MIRNEWLCALRRLRLFVLFGSFCVLPACLAQTAPAVPAGSEKYVLGPDDQITIRALEVDELDGKVARVDMLGYIDVPMLGRIKAAGLSVDQLEVELTGQLERYVRQPQVTVIVSEYHSQPVSVLGAVNSPGVYNLTGPNTLVQVLSKAGGLRNDAGNTINITRRREMGTIPLPSATIARSGEFSTAEVSLRGLLDAKDPENNIILKPTDVISVPKADLVYVVGAVHRSGGFVLSERENMTVLQAVSMAEGLEKTSAAKDAKIIRRGTSNDRAEIPVNLAKILSGKSPDVPLLANDILFIPNSAAKSAALRAVEAAIQTGSFVAGYAVFR
jgi:polysaccharide export outer membrane protein